MRRLNSLELHRTIPLVHRMSYELILGDRAYSSWSLRGWLLFTRFGIPFSQRFVRFADGPVADHLASLPPACTVPTMITEDGAVVSDSLAIAEELATRHPDAGIWPRDSQLRAMSRALAAEMHSGFAALREHCPMNLRCAYIGYEPPGTVQSDLDRIQTIWKHALGNSGGPWLCGEYSAADAFFAPVAARIAGYDLSVGSNARAYVQAHLADPDFRRWRAMSLVDGPDLARYARAYEQCAWPGPTLRQAELVRSGPSENAACPYSGKPVTHFLKLDGRVYGFCNAFCRDKTVADPEAWPAFMDIVAVH